MHEHEVLQQIDRMAVLLSPQQVEFVKTVYRFPQESALQLGYRLHVTESQIRKLGTQVRDKVTAYYAGLGVNDPAHITFSPKGYALTATAMNVLSPLSSEDRLLFKQANGLKEVRTETALTTALTLLHDLQQRYSDFAPIDATISDVHGLLAMHSIRPSLEAVAEAERYAASAIRKNPGLWLAHASMSFVRSAQWRWKEAQDSLDKAIGLFHRAHLHHALPLLYGALGKLEPFIARLDEEEQSVDFLPMSFPIRANLCFALFSSGQYEWELRILKGLIVGLPNYHLFYIHAALACSGLRRYEEALGYVEQAARLDGGKYLTPGFRVYCLAKLGRLQEEEEALRALKAREDWIPIHQFAVAYSGFGDAEEETVLECLEQAIDDHEVLGIWLYAWPQFFHLHSHPRFLALYRKMGLGFPGRKAAFGSV